MSHQPEQTSPLITRIEEIPVPPWDKDRAPRHVAIIPDGNRRWARARNLPVPVGHKQGVDVIEAVVNFAIDRDIDYLSIWGSSINNITKRSTFEVNALFRLYEDAAVRMLKRLKAGLRKRLEIRISGQWRELFPKSTVRKLLEMVDGSDFEGEAVVNLLMAYDGRDEMLTAVRKLMAEGATDVTPETLKDALWTHDMPPVDLVIRTGCEGDPHWSDGFMMWDVADAQMFFVETPWPDFGVEGFTEAVQCFCERERRLGS